MSAEQEQSQTENPIDTNEVADWFLQIIVSMANTLGISLGITVVSHGFAISGTLIGGEKYFEALGNSVRSATGINKEGAEALASALAQPGEIYRKSEGQDEPQTSSIGYIHLQDAKFYSGGAPIPSTGVLWRGRLSEISGFSLGSFSQTSNRS